MCPSGPEGTTGSYWLIGTVSWGPDSCNEPEKPGVFANVAYLQPSYVTCEHVLSTNPYYFDAAQLVIAMKSVDYVELIRISEL